VMPPSKTKICGAPRATVGGDRRAKVLHIPTCRRVWVPSDDVYVVEAEGRVGHAGLLVAAWTEIEQQTMMHPQGLRTDGRHRA
jgi:hypothetical protein